MVRAPKKIAVITPVLGEAGGIGRNAEETARRLLARGHQVTVFSPESERLRPVFKYGNAAWVPRLKTALRGFDIAHLHYPFIGAAGSMIAWKKSGLRAPLCVSYHMDLHGRGPARSIFRAHERHYLPRIALAADKIIVSSMDYARSGNFAPYLEKFGEKILEIPFAVDIERFFPAKAKPPLPNNSITFIFVGALDRAHYFKGVPVLFSAFKKLGGKHGLLIVGGGELLEKYERTAGELGISDRVKFCGKVSASELPDYYRGADCLILPSTDSSEAFGLVLLEAQASGIPVIASDLPGVRTAFVQGETGFAARPGSDSDLALRMGWMAENREERIKMGALARARMERYHSWGSVIEKLEDIYEKLSFVRRRDI